MPVLDGEYGFNITGTAGFDGVEADGLTGQTFTASSATHTIMQLDSGARPLIGTPVGGGIDTDGDGMSAGGNGSEVTGDDAVNDVGTYAIVIRDSLNNIIFDSGSVSAAWVVTTDGGDTAVILSDDAVENMVPGENFTVTIGPQIRPNQVYPGGNAGNEWGSPIQGNVVCFARGTMIRTQNGEIAIERLNECDVVETRDNGFQAIRWIGSTTVAAKGKNAPIMFKAGSVGNDKDLRVSPQHRMLLEGWKAEILFGDAEVFALAKHMVNGDTIYVDEGETVEYFHIMFDAHEVIFANGAATESFHPGENNMGAFSNETREEILSLFPQLRDDVATYGEAARYTLLKNEAKILSSL